MSFVVIPSTFQRPGRDNLYVERPTNYDLGMVPSINKTIGFATNERATYNYEMQVFSNTAWNDAITANMFVFAINEPSLFGLRTNAIKTSRITMMPLPLVNYLLASKSENFQSVEHVYETIKPLGVNTTAEPESTVTYRGRSVVMNIVVQGTSENTYDLWGVDSRNPLTKVYFVIKKMKIDANKALKYKLERDGARIEAVYGPKKTVFQIVPWASENGRPPVISDTIVGYYYVGRVAEPTELKDMYAKKISAGEDKLSRNAQEIMSKTKLVKLYID